MIGSNREEVTDEKQKLDQVTPKFSKSCQNPSPNLENFGAEKLNNVQKQQIFQQPIPPIDALKQQQQQPHLQLKQQQQQGRQQLGPHQQLVTQHLSHQFNAHVHQQLHQHLSGQFDTNQQSPITQRNSIHIPSNHLERFDTETFRTTKIETSPRDFATLSYKPAQNNCSSSQNLFSKLHSDQRFFHQNASRPSQQRDSLEFPSATAESAQSNLSQQHEGVNPAANVGSVASYERPQGSKPAFLERNGERIESSSSKEAAEGIQQELAKIQEIVDNHEPDNCVPKLPTSASLVADRYVDSGAVKLPELFQGKYSDHCVPKRQTTSDIFPGKYQEHYPSKFAPDVPSNRYPAPNNWYYGREFQDNGRVQYPYYNNGGETMMIPSIGFGGGWGVHNYSSMMKPTHSRFPESPPDSGSEPYSPSDGLLHQQKIIHTQNSTENHNAFPGNHNFPLTNSLFSNPYYQPYSSNVARISACSSALPGFALRHVGPRPTTLTTPVIEENFQLSKKRKLMSSPGLCRTRVKVEPDHSDFQFCNRLSKPDQSEDESQAADFGSDGLVDGVYKVISWCAFEQDQWVALCDENARCLPQLILRVDADKGFNYTTLDEAFVCQKKNHFQITSHVVTSARPVFVKSDKLEKVDAFFVHFHGIKAETPNQRIKIEQSQSDRSKKTFNPIRIEIRPDEMNKLTIGRLHFSETTLNNMRKKGKPNPDQRYFQLVVRLEAHCGSTVYTVVAQVSEKIIVRASNPGQFETDVEVIWNRGKSSDVIYHVGKVGVNTENPEEALSIQGNVRVTGHILAPSDSRIKTNITELDSSDNLRNIQNLRLYKFSYRDEYAEIVGMREEGSREEERETEAGVLAQQVMMFLPDAVREAGDVTLSSGEVIDRFLVVNKERIFLENIGATRELARVTGELDNRISEMETLKHRIVRFLKEKRDSFFSNASSNSSQVSSVSQPRKQIISTISAKCKERPNDLTNQKYRGHGVNESESSQCFLTTPIISQRPIVNQNRNNACSGRWMQILVIVLVIIMAICIVSITIMYIIDRNSGESKSKESIDSKLMDTSKTKPPDSEGNGKPLLPFHCIANPLDCPIVCCDPRLDDPGMWVPGSRAITRPRPETKTHKPYYWKSTLSPNDVNYDIEEEEDIVYEIDINRTKKKTKSHKSNNSHRRNKRETRMDYLQVLIVQLNLTLSSNYCTSHNCNYGNGNGKSVNITYSIPISENFPATFLTLQFVPEELNSNNYSITLCTQTKTSFCIEETESDLYSVSKVSNVSWDLPVGFYLNTRFTFRISSTLFDGVCNLPFSTVNATFSVYELNFHRQCI